MENNKYKIGDIVSFLYIDDNGHTYYEPSSQINNIDLCEHTNNKIEYYFINWNRNIQYVWVPEKRVFPANSKTAKVLYGS